ncbi:hypothetical protein [Bacillus paramycoides]|uniref:hypothetical protein n=1 Tax=Bacillus paramycoides TaxID=2026194 RepID=UPI00399D4F71
MAKKIAKSIDDMTAKAKSFEVAECSLITSKQGGTDFHSWVNKHHIASNKIIDDEIKGVEASLDSKGTGKIDYDELKVRLKERYKRFVDDTRQNIPQTSTGLLPNELNHGKFGGLLNAKGDNITGHHMPPNKYMQEQFEIKTKDSYAMVLEHSHPGDGVWHRRTFTYVLSKRTRPEDCDLYITGFSNV